VEGRLIELEGRLIELEGRLIEVEGRLKEVEGRFSYRPAGDVIELEIGRGLQRWRRCYRGGGEAFVQTFRTDLQEMCATMCK